MNIYKFSCEIAREAGSILRDGYHEKRKISEKAGRELVTSVDIASEKLLRERINKAYPEHNILAEEMGGEIRSDGWLWIIDPLDGTNNFAYGFPFFCVSIGLFKDGESFLGVVYEPLRDEMFTSFDPNIEIHSDGGVSHLQNQSHLNGEPIHVADRNEIKDCLFATGFPYDICPTNENNLDHFRKFCINGRGIRRGGSAALDLSYVASGRIDGFWEIKLKAWDIAAGFKIVENAGGLVSDFEGTRWVPGGDRVIAANPTVHTKMLNMIRNK